jgi:hypothetical protein
MLDDLVLVFVILVFAFNAACAYIAIRHGNADD